jgi:membrane protein YdbS with pleckstrin-like domain
MEKEIQTMLESEEKIVWTGKQDFKSAIISGFFISLVLCAIALLIQSFLTGGTCTINGQPGTPEQCSNMPNYFAYGLFAIATLVLVSAFINYKVTRYVISNKRLLLKSGWIGADIRSVYYNQMRSVSVNVGIIGKIFGTGTILIDTGMITQTKNGSQTVYDRFSNIKSPYDIIRMIQERLSSREEGVHSGRSDYENNPEEYKKFVKNTDKYKR